MKIKDKLDDIYKSNKYNFCNIDFELYPKRDFFEILDDENHILFKHLIKDYPTVYPEIKDIICNESIKEELRRNTSTSLIVCFYIGKPKEIVEGPISAKIKLV